MKFLETLGNFLNKTKSNEEQNFPEIKEVVIKLRDLLVCFVLFTLGLFFSIVVFVLEILIFFKTHAFGNS